MGRPEQNEAQSQQTSVPPSSPPPPFDGIEPNQDLYAPHLDYQKPPAMENQTQSRSTIPQPQAYPPAQSYETAPAPNAYPPPQSEIPHSFPPPQSQPNVNPQFHQQAGGVQYQQQYQQQPQTYQQQPQQTYQQNGVPIMGQPIGGQIPNQQLPLEAWKTGLFDCMQEPENAIITACFPCITFGQVAEIVDSGATSCATSGMWYSLIAVCIAMPCIISCTYRTKMRALFRLVESPAPDWVIHCFCDWCALCQEYRELKLRGYDPAIGWMGNVAVQRQRQQAAAMGAPMQQRMV